jgi:hypothetical protein
MDDKWHLFYELHWTSVRHKCGEAYVRLGTLGGIYRQIGSIRVICNINREREKLRSPKETDVN